MNYLRLLLLKYHNLEWFQRLSSPIEITRIRVSSTRGSKAVWVESTLVFCWTNSRAIEFSQQTFSASSNSRTLTFHQKLHSFLVKVIKVQQARESSSEAPIKPRGSSKWSWRASKMRNAFRKSIHQRFRRRRLLEKFYIRSSSKRLPVTTRRMKLRPAIARTPAALNSIVSVSKTTDIVVDTVGAVVATILRTMKKWDLRQKSRFLFETRLHSDQNSPSKSKSKTPRTSSAPTH